MPFHLPSAPPRSSTRCSTTRRSPAKRFMWVYVRAASLLCRPPLQLTASPPPFSPLHQDGVSLAHAMQPNHMHFASSGSSYTAVMVRAFQAAHRAAHGALPRVPLSAPPSAALSLPSPHPYLASPSPIPISSRASTRRPRQTRSSSLTSRPTAPTRSCRIRRRRPPRWRMTETMAMTTTTCPTPCTCRKRRSRPQMASRLGFGQASLSRRSLQRPTRT